MAAYPEAVVSSIHLSSLVYRYPRAGLLALSPYPLLFSLFLFPFLTADLASAPNIQVLFDAIGGTQDTRMSQPTSGKRAAKH